jgi:hypothetical protein
MRSRRDSKRSRKYRPGFEPPGQKTFPWWIVPVIVVVIGLAVGLIFLFRSGPEESTTTPTISPTLSPTTPSPSPTTAATPTPTATPVTKSCTVSEDTVVRNGPSVDSIGQDIVRGKKVNVIDTTEGDGYTWYRAMLPGYDEIRYIRVEAVDCE